MELMTLCPDIVYGPIHSRRFGRSLGINLLPTDCKFCTFSCVYCQYPDTPGKAPRLPSYYDVIHSVEHAFQKAAQEGDIPDWIMFSGNGEPTLHPHFPDIVKMVLALRDLHLPGVKVGILSNSSTCFRDDIKNALGMLDGRFMKLDAGSLYQFHDINRPSTMFSWGEVIEGLRELPNVAIQSMFVSGAVDNTDERSIRDWIDAIHCIWPVEVQVYTVDRLPQVRGILPVEESKLKEIAERLRKKTGIASGVYPQDLEPPPRGGAP